MNLIRCFEMLLNMFARESL